MPFLTKKEAFDVSDAILLTLYGSSTFQRWRDLKYKMKFNSEHDYVNWLMDVADQYGGGFIYPASTVSYQEEQAYQGETAPVEDDRTYGVKKEICDQITAAGSSRQLQPQVQQQYSTRARAAGEEQQIKCESGVSLGDHNGDYEGDGGSGAMDSDTWRGEESMDGQKAVYGDSGQGTVNSYGIDSVGSGSAKPAAQSDSYEEITVLSDVEGEECDGGGSYNMSYDDDVGNQDSLFTSDHEGNNSIIGEQPPGTSQQLTPSGQIVSTMYNGPSDDHTCPYCNYRGRRRDHVRRHVQSVHDKKKTFSCSYCQYGAARKDQLKVHMINKHGCHSDYICTNCNKPFSSSFTLNKHVANCNNTYQNI